jgi:hypothetical protein
MAGLTRLRFGPSRAQQRRHLLQRRFILDRRRQPVLDRRALRPCSGEASDLDAARYFHDKNTADGPR